VAFIASTTSSTQEARDVEVVGPDAVERREHATQHVEARLGGAGALERPEVADILDHDDHRGVAPRVGADRAGIAGVEVAAGAAGHHALRGLAHRAGERQQQLVALLHQRQHRAPRRARPQPGKPRQQLDQALEFGPGQARLRREA